MLKSVGKSTLKLDAEEKLRGKAQYAGDISFSNMLWLKVLRSEVPRARINDIDVSKALEITGVKGVFIAKDIPGKVLTGPRIKDEPVLCEKDINAVGDPIALVAAASKEIAAEALKHIRVDLEELAPVLTIEEAMDPDAPQIHADGNYYRVRRVAKGDAEAALRSADIVISNKYRTQMVEHAYIEPEAAVANYHEGKLTIWAPSKYINNDQRELARVLNLKPEEIRIILSTVGGYFGGKSGISPTFFCALATYLTGLPSKMEYTREESFISTTKRHPYLIEHTIGARKDGKIVAAEVKIMANTGAYSSFGPGVISRGAIHAVGPYEVSNVLIEAYSVYTNNPNAGAMRGFGAPQLAIAHENQIELLAERTGKDPIEIRKINYLKKGSYTITNQKLEHSVGLDESCDKVLDYLERNAQAWSYADDQFYYGWGMASMIYGIGITGLPNPATVRFSCEKDGLIYLTAGATDGGQGAATALLQIASESVGVPLDRVRLTVMNTDYTPDSGPSTASRLTYVVGRAVFEGGKELRTKLLDAAAQQLNCAASEVGFENGVFSSGPGDKKISLTELIQISARQGVSLETTGHFDPDTTRLDPETSYGSPYGTYTYATQAALVKVDKETGQAEVLKVFAAHDVGKAINPKMVEAQVEGGVVMGLGYGTMEEVILKQGHILNPGFHNYLIPTSMDIPDIKVAIVEDFEPTGPYGAKGVGEPALIPTAAAIRNAISSAVNCKFFEIPLTEEKIWKAITQKCDG